MLTEANAENEVTQAVFARLRNVTPPMVTRWKQAGRLVMNESGTRVLVRESMELLDSTLDPARGGDRSERKVRETRSAFPGAAANAPGEQTVQVGESSGSRSRDHEYRAAARDEKIERARLLKLDRMEREGELVRRAEVEAEAQGRATLAREAMMAIPDRLATQLAAESDVDKVRQMLEGEIRHVVSQLAHREQVQEAA